MAVFDVYSRRGCHLCEVLIEELLLLVQGRAAVEVHDIDSRAEWRDRYDTKVPVVVCEGVVLCEYQLDSEAILAALAVGA